MKSELCFLDINHKKISNNIETIFPDWKQNEERVCVFSPHDDDALIGAGYAMQAAKENGAGVYIFIFCSGNAGYSKEDKKDTIVDTRREETYKAYKHIGIKPQNIFRFEIPDFSVLQSIGWKLNNGSKGSFKKVISILRKLKITRVLVPNHYREHIDHFAVNLIGSYDSPQAGDPVVVDWAKPHPVKSLLEYSVWADLSPEDAFVCGRDPKLRANRLVAVSEKYENEIQKGISEYASQHEIIKGLIKLREERLCKNGMYIEPYLLFDPRPKLDFAPYRAIIEELKDKD